MGISPQTVYGSRVQESTFSIEMAETMANEETSEVQKNIHDDSHESPFTLSKENEFAIEGDINEVSINTMVNLHEDFLFMIDKIKNDNSYVDDLHNFLEAGSFLEEINRYIDLYTLVIEKIKNGLQDLETGANEIALLLAGSKFFPEPSTDSSEGGESEDG